MHTRPHAKLFLVVSERSVYLKRQEIRDRIAVLSNFRTNCKLLYSLNKNLCVLEFLSWGEVSGIADF